MELLLPILLIAVCLRNIYLIKTSKKQLILSKGTINTLGLELCQVRRQLVKVQKERDILTIQKTQDIVRNQ